MLIALLFPLTFAGAHSENQFSPQRDAYVAQKKINEEFLAAMLLASNQYAGEVDYEKIARSSIVGMLRTLDPHSSYFDPKQWEKFFNDQRSRYFGIGSIISQRNNRIYIISPTTGTPSYRAGFRYGDEILEVNGEKVTGMNVSQVSSRLIGPEGTSVTVKIQRLGEEPSEHKFTRASVPFPSITNTFMLGKGVGYVNLQRGFNTTTADEMERSMQRLKAQGMSALVLDLRDNGGGLVDQAWQILNRFLYRGQKIVSLRGRPGVFPSRDFAANNTSPEDIPLVVLVNRYSASASEIVAGALQDHDRARIVGENSFGKGLVQNPFPLNDGSGLILTTGKYYTPSGRLIQREYSGKSFYDYYLQRGNKEAVQQGEEKRTDSGRAVYSGGGIQPDVESKVRYTPQELKLQRDWYDAVFEFVRPLVAGQIAGLTEFKLNGPADHSHNLAPDELVVTDKVIDAFRKFLKGNKDFSAMEARISKDVDFLKRQIRYELVTAAYGADNAYQILLEADNQILAAIAEVPKAKVMAEDAARARSARGDLRRND
jgi:carboxyl-terminal processing protease